ncbi:hypothetical protein [Nocardia brevicatena]|uniref:hypothetical protein n=1 Tax=Nocardia brevicatena TaxID=37327 RepID=UPI0012F89FC7|nr:hypothetical protein [Nocardia brevicatena]
MIDDPRYRGLLIFSDGTVSALGDDGFPVELEDLEPSTPTVPGAAECPSGDIDPFDGTGTEDPPVPD